MKAPLRSVAVLALLTALPALAAPTAVERQGVVLQGGLQFQKVITLDSPFLCDGSVRLDKGSYDVTFKSLQTAHTFRMQGGKVDLVLQQGSNQILVGLQAAQKVHEGMNQPPAGFQVK